MPKLSDSIQAAIRRELEAAPHGQRGAAVAALAGRFGVSAATIYRAAGRGGARRPRQGNAEWRDWVRRAVAIAHSPGDRPMPLDLALEIGVQGGSLPPEAASLPIGTAYRIRRELGLHRQDRRTHPLFADYPMQAAQLDGSSSMYLTVAKRLDDGDWLLRLHRRPTPARGYKNKPLGPGRERALAYGLWDMATGYRLSRYAVAVGESGLDAMDFLCWAMGRDKDPRLVMHGVVENLWSDQGPLVKSAPVQDLLDRLGVKVVLGRAYRKTRMAGVERGWRTLWSRFERALFARGKDEISLSELNARLTEWTVRENARRQARQPVGGRLRSRADAWTMMTNARPAGNRLRLLPEGAMQTLALERRCRVDANGHIRWDGREYELPGLWNTWVTARRALDGSGRVVAEAPDGARLVAAEVARRPYGELRGLPKSPLERLLDDEAERAGLGADIYAPRGGAPAPGVAALPGRSEPAAALDNPLATGGAYGSLGEAMAAFARLYPHPLAQEHKDSVRRIIDGAGWDRQAVAELASGMLTLAETPKRRREQ